MVEQYVALLLTFPAGRLWARFMPEVKILGVALNPGPFTIKEHVLITIMAGVGAGSAYAVYIVPMKRRYVTDDVLQTDIIAVQRVYYNQQYNFICTSPIRCHNCIN